MSYSFAGRIRTNPVLKIIEKYEKIAVEKIIMALVDDYLWEETYQMHGNGD